jgi:hypothetical protein
MGKLKPTRVSAPRIVQPGTGGRPWLWVVFLVALSLWTWQVFEFGRQRGGYDASAVAGIEKSLQQQIATLESERDELRKAAARFERTAQVDRAAVRDVQDEVKALQDERAELRREVAFLKTLVSGGSAKLALDDDRLVAAGNGTFQFEVTLSKQTDDADTVTGMAVIKVVGNQDGVKKTLDMAAITQGKRNQIGIRFKNFQKLKTAIALPEAFEPEQIEVRVEPQDKKFEQLERVYDWQVAGA